MALGEILFTGRSVGRGVYQATAGNGSKSGETARRVLFGHRGRVCDVLRKVGGAQHVPHMNSQHIEGGF